MEDTFNAPPQPPRDQLPQDDQPQRELPRQESPGDATPAVPDALSESHPRWDSPPSDHRTAEPRDPDGIDPQSRDERFYVQRFDMTETNPQSTHRRALRINLVLLLCCTLAGFILATWVLVRVDSPFGVFSTGPREVVRAQLRALNRGEIRGAYDLLSDQYRRQVNFRVWQEMIVRHWPMFHAEVLRAGNPAQSGTRTTLEIHLRGADQKAYRARFTLIRTEGRWWIDDVHWAEEPDEHDVSRT